MAAQTSVCGQLAAKALTEIAAVFEKLKSVASSDDPCAILLREILAAREHQIVLHGVGREGLMMRALAMRLAHLGLAAHCVGDMGAPPVGPADLLLVSAGPGGFATVDALLQVARAAGARTAVVTAQPRGSAAALADTVACLPAQTMADDLQSGCTADPSHYFSAAANHSEAPSAPAGTDGDAAGPGGMGTDGAPRQAEEEEGAGGRGKTAEKGEAWEEEGDSEPMLPMGSVYEGALFVLGEVLVQQLRGALGETGLSMRARHTNLE